jgi:N-acetylglutamate synthase-like GNAT family acetyltransferase
VPTPDLIREIVEAQASTVLIARDVRDSGRIVGMLTLVVFRIPTGVRAWIEDVVVDETVRGRGVGEALSQEAIRRAVGLGARTVELTSRPSGEAANRLYQRLGFTLWDSNVYRYTPCGQQAARTDRLRRPLRAVFVGGTHPILERTVFGTAENDGARPEVSGVFAFGREPSGRGVASAPDLFLFVQVPAG